MSLAWHSGRVLCCFGAFAMSKARVRDDISRCRTRKSLQQALDQTYRRIREAAKTDWNRLFAGQDPSDEAVTVHISKDQMAQELAGIPRAGFLPVRSKPVNDKIYRYVGPWHSPRR